jgi:hypothetical protein
MHNLYLCSHDSLALVYRLLNALSFVAFKMGRLRGGPSRTGAKGAYLDRYVTDEQRSSRPIFNATLRSAAGWLFFRVARSTRMTKIWALRSRLEKQPTDLRRNSRDLGDGTPANHLAIRNYLRTHAEAAKEYGELKKRLAEQFPQDIDGYVDGKTTLLLEMLRASGFPPQQLWEIERANRR